MIIRAFNAVWYAITWLFGWLWFIISWPFKKLCCCFKPSYEPIEIDSGSDVDSDSDSDFEEEVRVIDSEGNTPRNAEARIDDLLNAIAPEVREKLAREYELKNRMPPLIPIHRTLTAPARIETQGKNETEVLEERKAEENTKSDL